MPKDIAFKDNIGIVKEWSFVLISQERQTILSNMVDILLHKQDSRFIFEQSLFCIIVVFLVCEINKKTRNACFNRCLVIATR